MLIEVKSAKNKITEELKNLYTLGKGGFVIRGKVGTEIKKDEPVGIDPETGIFIFVKIGK
jgi:hypothetical protein